MSIGPMLLRDHCPRIAMFGMSCVGKTTFAKMIDRPYFCFDAMFNWHLIETLGLSISHNLRHIQTVCDASEQFVLDGWHLSDKKCELLPPNTTVYVLYDDYGAIIDRYRVPVMNRMEHHCMFKKWYDIDITRPIRYFRMGNITETSKSEFITCLERNL